MPSVVRTVRFRVTVLASVAVALVLSGVAVALLVAQQRQLDDTLDEAIRRRADELAVGGTVVDGAVTILPSAAGDDVVIQIVTPEGEVVAGTQNAAEAEPIAPPPGGEGVDVWTAGAVALDDDEYRILSRVVRADGRTLVVHVGENTDDLQELQGRLRAAVLVTIPIAVVVLAALVWWLVGRTLRPVERIRSEVAGFAPAHLDRRVTNPGTGDEIDRLAITMNQMLDRLEDSTVRQQRFVADASHELRSPLTRMRTELETSAATSSDGSGRATVQSVLDEIDELTALVDDLLLLARSDAEAVSGDARPVDLDDLVFEEVTAIRRTAPEVTIDVGGVSAGAVLGSRSDLRRVVRNLLDNAVRHAESRIEVTLAERSADGRGWATLTITDDGPGIPPDQAAAVFERFTRLDDSRTRRDGGSGLGLAITRDLVELHGGSIRIDSSHGGGARFEVELPAAV